MTKGTEAMTERETRQAEFDRFCELMAAFVQQIKDDVLREELERALQIWGLINAE